MPRLSAGIGGARLGSTLQNTQNDLPVVYSQDIQGGLTTVNTIAERNAIPTEKVQLGMLVYVTANSTYYRFVQGSLMQANSTSPFTGTIDNTNWQTVQFGGGGGGGSISAQTIDEDRYETVNITRTSATTYIFNFEIVKFSINRSTLFDP